MGGNGARGKDWLRKQEHHVCLTDTIFLFVYFFFGGGGRSRGTLPFTLREHGK